MVYSRFRSRVLVLYFTLLLLVNSPFVAYGQRETADSNLTDVPTIPQGVLSPTAATFPFFDDFEASGLVSDWATTTSGTGVAEISTDNPHSGSRHIFLGQKVVDDGHASLVLSINLANQPEVFLDFWWRATGNVSPAGNASRSGVYISEDSGVSWKKIRDLTGNAQSYNHELINLVTAAAAQGLTLNDHFLVSFHFERVNNSISLGGLRIDDIRVTTRSQLITTFPMEDGFESQAFVQGFYPQSTDTGFAEISNDNPYSGVNHAYIGQKVTTGNVTADILIFTDLTSQPDVFLDFWWRAVGNASSNGNGSGSVAISDDYGVNWKKIIDLSSNAQSYNHEVIDLVNAAASQGLTLNNHFLIRFRFQRVNNSISLGGLRLDNIRLTTRPQVLAPFPLQDSFEANTFSQGIYPRSGGQGIVEISNENSHTGTYHVFIGQKQVDDAYALFDLFVDLSDRPTVFLDFWWRTTGDVSPNGNAGSSGVYISDDYGVNWTKVMHLTSNPRTYQYAVIDIAKAALDNGKVLNDHFLIRFFFRRSNDALTLGSLRFDDIRLSDSDPTPRIYLPIIRK